MTQNDPKWLNLTHFVSKWCVMTQIVRKYRCNTSLYSYAHRHEPQAFSEDNNQHIWHYSVILHCCMVHKIGTTGMIVSLLLFVHAYLYIFWWLRIIFWVILSQSELLRHDFKWLKMMLKDSGNICIFFTAIQIIGSMWEVGFHVIFYFRSKIFLLRSLIQILAILSLIWKTQLCRYFQTSIGSMLPQTCAVGFMRWVPPVALVIILVRRENKHEAKIHHVKILPHHCTLVQLHSWCICQSVQSLDNEPWTCHLCIARSSHKRTTPHHSTSQLIRLIVGWVCTCEVTVNCTP